MDWLLVSGIQQSDSVTYMNVSILFQIIMNIKQSSLCYTVIYFKYNVMYMSIPIQKDSSF